MPGVEALPRHRAVVGVAPSRGRARAGARHAGESTRDRRTPFRRAARAVLWLPGLAVALGAAVATAHGLYEVALAAARARRRSPGSTR